MYLRVGDGDEAFAPLAVNPNMQTPFSDDFVWTVQKMPDDSEIAVAYSDLLADLSASEGNVQIMALAPRLSFERAVQTANRPGTIIKANDLVTLQSKAGSRLGFNVTAGRTGIGICTTGEQCDNFIFKITKADGLGPVGIGGSICLSTHNGHSSLGYPAQVGAMALSGQQGQTGVQCPQSTTFSVMPPWGSIPHPLSLCTGQAVCSSISLGPNTTIGNNVNLINQQVTRGRITINGQQQASTNVTGGVLASNGKLVSHTTTKSAEPTDHQNELIAGVVLLAVVALGAVYWFTGKPKATLTSTLTSTFM
jgi:hypothetical protein